MSNNSMVCADGSEIGRAQYLQAQAAAVEAESAMNPVLLKPASDGQAFVVLRGRPYGTLVAGQYPTGRAELAEAAFAAYEELAARFDVIISEGAGSPAEINLRSGDYVNLGLARRFHLPVVVVGDIDRGGVFASLYGTVELLEPADRALVRAFLINKFRGDKAVLRPGLDALTARTGVPFAGVLPWLPDLWLDAEDTLAVARWQDPGPVDHSLRVAVVRLPRMSNITDVDALAAEPGVEVVVTTNTAVIATADRPCSDCAAATKCSPRRSRIRWSRGAAGSRASAYYRSRSASRRTRYWPDQTDAGTVTRCGRTRFTMESPS